IAAGTSQDCNNNGIPDSCESPTDCNNNGIPDICEPGGTNDCNGNGVIDFCELAAGAPDCNANSIPDACDAASGNLSLQFDGTNDLVRLPNDLIHSRTRLTFEAWFRTSGSGVILGYQNAAYPATPSNYGPGLYVGLDG